MNTYLLRLSNSEFRKTEAYIRSRVLPCLENDDYWDALHHLLMFRRQAFLSGLVAVERLAVSSRLDFTSPSARKCFQYIEGLGPEVMVKAMNMLLPLMRTVEQITQLTSSMSSLTEEQLVNSLLKVDSPLVYFVLFKTLKRLDHNPEIAHRCSLVLIRRNTDMAFNIANIIRVFFGLETLSSQFSLKIEPYELNYLDRDFATFLNFLEGKRPKI